MRPGDVMASLKEARQSRNLTALEVAKAVGCERGNLHRIESGKQMPKQPLARSLWRFYEGEVPLGAIYDPVFHEEISK